jgi:hypothetical protein
MSDQSTESQPATPVTNSPPDVTEAQAQQAKKEVEKLAQQLGDVVLQQQAPPGTPKPKR